MPSTTTGNPNPPPGRGPSGRSIDGYLLLDIIGEGGFGIVWKAERLEPFRQIVAIKMIKPGMGSEEVLARFEHERQALALMSHHAVATVFGGGVAPPEFGERPYFVMEYVPGKPITEYCDQRRLNIRERLELFAQVCEGVQHAHSKGIIHRDLTPRNILVVEHNDQPQPKIIDFGISKALGRPLTDKVIFTHDGRMMGVPEYISPEQAQGLDVDTRSDVYSLGVLLYELLTGAPPFDRSQLLSRGWEAMLKFIREAERPHPSTRLSSLGDSADEIAHRRQARPASLTSELARGLGWIPLKALEPERNRRYQTPLELVADIRRYLNDDYDPPFGGRALDRARRFVRRNRRVLAVASLIILALTAWLMGAIHQRNQTLIAKANADAEAVAARKAEAMATRNACEANIAAASALLASDNAASARARLDACDIAHREWEWRLLHRSCDQCRAWAEADDPLIRVCFGTDQDAIHAFGTHAVWVFRGPSLNKSALFDFRPHLASGIRTAMSRDGDVVLFRLREKDAVVGLSISRGRNPPEPVDLGCPADSWCPGLFPLLSADGRVIVAPITSDGRARLVVIGQGVRVEIASDTPYERLALSPSGDVVAAGRVAPNGEVAVTVWATAPKAVPTHLRCDPVGDTLNDLSIGDGAAWIAATGPAATVVARRDAEFRSVRVKGGAEHMSLDPDGRFLAVSLGTRALVHDLRSGASATLRGHFTPIRSLAISDDGKRVAAAALNGVVGVWDVRPDEFDTGLRAATGGSSTADGRLILMSNAPDDPDPHAGRKGAGLAIFDTRARAILPLPHLPSEPPILSALAPDGAALALVSRTSVHICDLTDGRPRYSCTLAQLGLVVEDIAADAPEPGARLLFAPRSTTELCLIASGKSGESRVCLVNVSEPAMRVLTTFDERYSGVLATSPGMPLALAWATNLLVWESGLDALPRTIRGVRPAGACAADRSGKRLAIAALLGNLVFVDPAGGEAHASKARHAGRAVAAAWLDDPARLATGGIDGNVIIWDSQALTQQLILPMGAPVVALAARHDAPELWVLLANGRIRVLSAAAPSGNP